MSTTPAPEPYVGPRPFDRKDYARFFGREREADDLLSLVLAHPVVLIYAASGAGKSSLLNAGLIPRLIEEGYQVLGPARVTGPMPPDTAEAENIYRFHALTRWNSDVSPPAVDASELPSLALAEFLRRIERRDGAKPRALLLDQFEEFFTANIGQTEQRRAFIEELAEALRSAPRLRVVFAMREEYVTQLEPFAHSLPDKLRTRMRLEPLRERAARDAIRKPLESLGLALPVEPEDPAEALVRELLKVHVDAGGGQAREMTGEFVEPVQLQVVCQNMWRNFPPEIRAVAERPRERDARAPKKIISPEHVHIGDVDQALAQHYENAITDAVQVSDASEGELRRWFDSALITPAGIRGIALCGGEDTAHLPQAALDVFVDRRLVRLESRGGSAWYELTHDRFIDPIQRSNRTWIGQSAVAEALRRRLEARAETAGALLDESETREAEAFLASPESKKLGTARAVADLVRASREHVDRENARKARELADAQRNAEIQEAAARRARARGRAAGMALVVCLGLLVWAGYMHRKANAMRAQAEIQGLASYLTAEALKQQPEQLDRSLLLSVEAYRVAAMLKPATEKLKLMKSRLLADAKSSLLKGLVSSPHLIRFAHGHQDELRKIVARKDGRVIITGAYDGTIIFWNESFVPLTPPLKKHREGIFSLALSPDERTLVSASADGAILVWDVSDVTALPEPVQLNATSDLASTGAVYSVDISPDGKTLVSGDAGGAITLWDLAARKPISSVSAHNGKVYRAIFTPSGDVVASCGNDNKVGLWKLEGTNLRPWKELAGTAEADGKFVGHPQDTLIFNLALSPDGSVLASGGQDGTAVLWRLSEPEPVPRPLHREGAEKAHQRGIYGLAFSLDNRVVAIGSADQTISLWEVATGDPYLTNLNGYAHGVYSLAYVRQGFEPGGRLLAGMVNGALSVWEPEEEQAILSSYLPSEKSVNLVAYHPSGSHLASAVGNTGTLLLTDMITFANEELKGHDKGIASFAFAPDGKTCAGGSYDGKILIWNLADKTPTALDSQSENPIFGLAYSPDSKLLFTSGGAESAEILVWDVASRTRLRSLTREGAKQVTDLAVSRDGRTIAVASRDRVAALWRVEDWQLLGTLPHDRPPNTIAFSPDGKIVATAAWKQVTLWDAASRESIAVLKKHEDDVNRVVFSPDGEVLASAGEDKTIVLWNVATREPLASLTATNGALRDVAYSPDGRILAAAGRNTLLWDVSFDSWQARAAEIAGRNLTPEEWTTYLQDEPYRETMPYGLALQAHQHARRGEGKQAHDLFERAVNRAITLRDTRLNNSIAWIAILDGYASVALPACDVAIREAQPSSRPFVLDTRAVAFASLGRLNEAAADLEAYVNAPGDKSPEMQRRMAQRKEWLTQLRAGRNPINDKVLAELRVMD